MFFYISFLRPPPLQANTSEPILITPQICNDLRTEYLDDLVDIYYAWSLEPRASSTPTTTSTKLTSWRPGMAYKQIPVPRPPVLPHAHGRSWRLVLSCGPAHTHQFIPLGQGTMGATPFGVTSMAVTFVNPRQGHGQAKGTKHTSNLATKQERIARSYAIQLPLQDRPITFDVTEQTSFDLDKVCYTLLDRFAPGWSQKVWDSGIGLSSWLVRLFTSLPESNRPATELLDLCASLFSTDPRHILELGAGTGIVSITLAILRSTLDLSDQPGSIVTTDLPSAMAILQDNINTTSNQLLMQKCIPEPDVLDWEDEQLSPLVRAQLDAGLDVIVMADVTYNTASFSALTTTLSRLIQLSNQRPKVLMGYKERHLDERSLWDRVKEIGIDFHQIGQIDGAGGAPVEIWLG